jgi:hypothetical protein
MATRRFRLPSFSAYVDCLDRDDWAGVAELMLASAKKLAYIGADFLICPDNTIHQALPHVLPRSPLPWLSIAEVVADEAVRRRFRRLGLTGTRWLVAGGRAPRPDELGEAARRIRRLKPARLRAALRLRPEARGCNQSANSVQINPNKTKQNCLDFLGFIRPNRDFSMGYE